MTIRIDGNKVFVKDGVTFKQIGVLNKRTLTVTRDRSRHLMRKFDAYGFAKALFEQNFFDFLVIKENNNGEKSIYLIEKDVVMTEGRFFKADAYESQVFLSIELLKKYNIDKK